METPMTVKELTEYLKLDKMTIYKMIECIRFPGVESNGEFEFGARLLTPERSQALR